MRDVKIIVYGFKIKVKFQVLFDLLEGYILHNYLKIYMVHFLEDLHIVSTG